MGNEKFLLGMVYPTKVWVTRKPAEWVTRNSQEWVARNSLKWVARNSSELVLIYSREIIIRKSPALLNLCHCTVFIPGISQWRIFLRKFSRKCRHFHRIFPVKDSWEFPRNPGKDFQEFLRIFRKIVTQDLRPLTVKLKSSFLIFEAGRKNILFFRNIFSLNFISREKQEMNYCRDLRK